MYSDEQSGVNEELEKVPSPETDPNNVKYLLLTAMGKKKDIMRVIVGGNIL
ncbi:MAG: hypothetical protein HQK97_13375 [Nitrospirae bacterium]|nr:hypothetical protein [Nitrospirota bacterium]